MLIPFGVFSAAGAGATNSFELISTTVGTGSTGIVDFNVSGLGTTYKHLQIRAVLRTDYAASYFDGQFRFNSDSGANYALHQVQGNGSSVTSAGGGGATGTWGIWPSGSSAGANIYGSAVIDILDAFSTTKNKTLRSLSGNTAGNVVGLQSSVWFNTAALTTIRFNGAGNLTTASRISLYGIRG